MTCKNCVNARATIPVKWHNAKDFRYKTGYLDYNHAKIWCRKGMWENENKGTEKTYGGNYFFREGSGENLRRYEGCPEYEVA